DLAQAVVLVAIERLPEPDLDVTDRERGLAETVLGELADVGTHTQRVTPQVERPLEAGHSDGEMMNPFDTRSEHAGTSTARHAGPRGPDTGGDALAPAILSRV